jgi:hypothetical protein
LLTGFLPDIGGRKMRGESTISESEIITPPVLLDTESD